jgi:undecaprenyl-diphosphatase
VAGWAALTYGTYLVAQILDDGLDWRILLRLNPTDYVPVVDELLLCLTDFAYGALGLALIGWAVAYALSGGRGRGTPESRRRAARGLRIAGVICALIAASAWFWGEYDRRIVFFPLALMLLGLFLVAAEVMTRCGERRLRLLGRVFWLSILSVFLVHLAAQEILKPLVARPRPLSNFYAPLNFSLYGRKDEYVVESYSYVSSHSATFFAMITPLLWYVARPSIRLVLLGWGIVLAYSRVYLAAHFPSCSLMGAVLGASVAALVIWALGPSRLEGGCAEPAKG